MSIKNLFSNKPSTMQSANSASSDIESPDLIESLRKQREEVVPPIDFLSASNFVRFGSAKEYYAESIKRVYNTYPYDGSQKEKIEFNLSSSYLDRYIYDYKYPKIVGYANFASDSHIQINRGYNQATVPSSNKLSKLFQDKDPYHDSDNRKKQSFVFDLDDGVTIEWWMKKAAFGTGQETFFELKSSNVKMDLVLTGTTEPVKFYGSSSAEISLSTISDTSFTSASLANDTWSHYAVSISNNTTNTIVDFYRNGVHKKQNSFTKISSPTGNITGFLASGSYGLLSASVDEFRYWNKKQTSESIYSNYISGINGGGNTDEYRKEISVYFKFNEGKTGTDTTDRIVLDYSGRLSNGYWNNYNSSTSRQSGSYTSSEVADPIVRSSHPLVQSLLTEMQTSGSAYDANSKMQLYDLIPAWIRDEDEQNGEEFKHIIQIIASYFDTLYAQIEFLPNIKNKHYYQDDEKPLPFIRRILEERGMAVSDILINRTLVEYFQKKDLNGIQYQKDLEILKNRIYHNIYNNLEYIYKTKGTEKSYRNMLRCFGIDDELVKLNLYTDNGVQYLVDKTKHTSQKTKHIDFDQADNFSATVFQQNNISGSTTKNLEKNNAITLEVEMLVPRKPEQSSENYYYTSFVSSSVFGLDAVDTTTSAYVSTTNLNNFQVYLVRDAVESNRAKWVVEQTNHSAGTKTIVASSDFYEDIYDNQRWNVAVKVYPQGYPFAGSFATTANPNYILELYGVTHNFDEVLHEFTTTASLSYTNGTSLLAAKKKVYVGARRTNWSGSILHQSDLKIAACSLYYDKLDSVSIKQHNLDPSNYGHNRIFGNPTPFLNSATNTHLPAQHSLALHWDFQTVTGSDSSGQFTVEDFSSASVNGRYGWLGNIVVQEHKGTGFGFPASNTSLVKNEFIFASKKELPEISFTSDNITIVGDDNIYLYEDEDVNDNVFAFEKSMYQVVSQEMLNLFTTMIEYSNMFAKPVDRYRFNYKRLAHARKLFFEKTSTDLDLDRFTEYYKWIDSSISFFLEQLHPSNAKFNKGITETIESHILERPKYQHILPNIEEHKTIKEQPVRGIGELTYNWKSGHAPAPGEAAYTNDNLNCLWRKEREKRTGVNATQREQLKTVISSDTYVEEIPSFGTNTGTTYQGSTYGLRRFSRPHKLSIKEQKTIHGGINYERAKDRDLLKAVTPRHGEKNSLGVPTDVVVLGVGPGQGLLDNQACEERNQNPTYKEKYGSVAIVGRYSNFDGSSPISGAGVTTVTTEYAYNLRGQRIFPFNLVSGTISTGYNAVISSSYYKDVYLTNLHSDTTDPTNEIPMQGPFTKTWVGGRQSRHVPVNTYKLPTRATGSIVLVATPVDDETITISDGLTSKTFIFKSSPSGDLQVSSAGSMETILGALKAKIELIANNLNITCSVSSDGTNTMILTNLRKLDGQSDEGTNTPITETMSNVGNIVKGFTGGTAPLDNQYTRPEEWRILVGDHPDSADQDGALGLTGPDYGGPYPDPARQSAAHYRDGRAKRPVNIQNVQTTGGVKGNYDEKYEVLSVVGTKENNLRLREFESTHDFLPTELGNALPETTNLLTLATVAPAISGNVWGVGESNRINSFPDVVQAGVLASGSFVLTSATVYKAAYTGSMNVQPIPFKGTHQSYYFQVSGATDYYEIYTGSFDVQGVPHAGISQTYAFKATGSTYLSGVPIYTGSFNLAAPPIAEQHDYISFKVSGSAGLSDENLLQLTASSTNKLIEVDTDGTLSHSPDIFVDTYRRAIQHTDISSYARLAESSYQGFGTTNFTVSFWLNNVTATSVNGNNFLYFYNTGNTLRHYIIFDDDIKARYMNDAGSNDIATFNTNIAGTSGWNHYVITFSVNDLSSGVPKLWKNGTELSDTGGFSSVGGTTPDIDYLLLGLDEGYALQDLVFWNIVFDQTDVDELYNSGNWFDPSTHTHASNVIGWHPFGEEPEHRNIEPGQDFFSDGSSTEYFYPVYYPAGDASNGFSMNTNYDEHAKIIKGKGNKTNTEIWNNLTASLESEFSGYTATYISGATDAQFFLRKNTAGSNTVSTTKTGTSFDNLASGSGATAVASNLEDGDTISISGSTFTVRHTTSGSAVTDFKAGNTFRKAITFPPTSTTDVGLKNLSYTSPTVNPAYSISFWAKTPTTNGTLLNLDYGAASFKGRLVRINYNSSTNSLDFRSSNGTTIGYPAFSVSSSLDNWNHYTFIVYYNMATNPKLWVNGVSHLISGSHSRPSGVGRSITEVFVGESNAPSSNAEWQGGIQDLVIWNTELDQEDANVLYNSGSWFDIHSHVSASSIWDWWLLGEESGMPASGSTLNSAGVSSISPTIGRHALTPVDNTKINTTRGILDTAIDSASWYSHVASTIQSQTNYSASNSSNTINMNQTSSAVISDSLTNSNDTFTSEAVFGIHGYTPVLNYISGAVDGNQLQIEDEVFIVSTGSSPSTFASSSGGIKVNSTGSEFWNFLSGAIETHLPEYTASYFVYDNQANFFVRRSSSADIANDTFTESGDTFSNLHLASGSAPSASSNLVDGDTLALDGDTFNLRYTTSGSAATDFIVGTQYRKAFNWKKTESANRISLKNVSYDGASLEDVISFSFWVKFDQDAGSNTQYIFQGLDSSGDGSINIQRLNEDLEIDHTSTAGSVTHKTTGDDLPTGKWLSVSIKIDTSNIDTAPVVYVNGQQKSITSGTAVGGAARGLGRVYIADNVNDVPFAELQGSLQDFVIWNTGLGSQDATILYNSGSWLDIHSHPSASYIWDWWEFSGSVSGSAINSIDNSITSVAPTVGRHTLVYDDDTSGNVFVSDGIVENKKTSSAFKTHVAEVIRSQTVFSASISSILLEVTAAVDVHSTGSFSEQGTSFTTSSNGIEFVKYGNYYSGSIPNNTLVFEGKTFIVSASTTPSSTHTIDGNNIYVYSHQDLDTTWWGNLTGAIQAALPYHTASYFQSGTMAHFFVRSGSEGYKATTISETGDTFWYPYMATGSVSSGSSTLADQDTLSITDNTGTKTFTIGHTTSGSAARYFNTGDTFRKALKWLVSSTNEVHFNNDAYSNPSSNYISFSFWLNATNTDSNSKYILNTFSGGSNEAIAILWMNQKITISQANSSGASRYWDSSDTVTTNKFDHYTIYIDRTDVTTAPILYKNGQVVSISPASFHGTATGAGSQITKFYLGDFNVANSAYETHGALQDFVVWNTGLSSQDSKILFNSGSWFDIHSHVSASSIWDWWMLGEESNIPQRFGQALNNTSLGSAVTKIEPTVGRHTLTVSANSQVEVTSGSMETGKRTTQLWSELTQSISSSTEFNESYVSNLFGTNALHFTASTQITSSMMLQETVITAHPAGTNVAGFAIGGGTTTFSVPSPSVIRGPERLEHQRYVSGGASQGEYIYIAPNDEETTGSYFIMETSNDQQMFRNPGATSYGFRDFTNGINQNYYVIRSSASSNSVFWNRVKTAIETVYPKYTITLSSASAADNTCRFDLTGSREITYNLTDTSHINNRIASPGKKALSISSPTSSTSTNSYLYNNSVTEWSASTTGGMSISFWAKLEKSMNLSSLNDVNRFIFDSYDSSDNRAMYLKFLRKSSHNFALYFGVYDGSENLREWYWDNMSPTNNVAYYRGRHYTLTWDGNFANNPELYIDGVIKPSSHRKNPVTTGTGTTRETINKIYLLNSASTDTTDNELMGSINDFAFWKTTLSQVDVNIIYNSGSWYNIADHTSASVVVDWWRLGHEDYIQRNFVPNDPIPVNTIFSASSVGANDISASAGLVLSLGFANYATASQTYSAVTGVAGGLDEVIETGLINVVKTHNTGTMPGLTRQKSIIASRFSAPGGVEVQTYGYLDAYAHEYSVHNSLNFRNQPVKLNSGETGTIRVNSHANRREGLNTLYRRHSGKFGLDSTYGAVTANSYDGEASFHKVHRNRFTKPLVRSKALRRSATTDGLVSINGSVSTLKYATTGEFSVSFWLKLDDEGIADRTVYSAMNGTDFANRFFIKNQSMFWIFYNGSNQTAYFTQYFNNVNLSYNGLTGWTHFALAWNGKTDGDGAADFFINGVKYTDSTATSTMSPANIRRAADSFHLFDIGNGSSAYELEGSLQEFITWNKRLEQSDVDQIYNGGSYFDARNSNSENSILDYWTLGRGEEFDPYDYGSFIPTNFTIKSIHGTSKANLTTNSQYQVVPGYYYTSDESKPTRKDNYFIQSSLPSSDYNYSWVTSSLGNNYNVRSGTQKVFGYWPKKGEISSSSGFDSAITFPTASDIQGS